jgi:SAM-dependent methyltransferase
MEATEVRKLAELEDKHWWYRERRAVLARELDNLARAGVPAGRALDIGAAGGGNTRVLRNHGWRATALEYGAEGAGVARGRKIPVIRADAIALPVADEVLDLVVAFDVLEHIEDDKTAAHEIARVLRPGGAALIAVPCDMNLWSEHDTAVGHVRRYDRDGLVNVLSSAGLRINDLRSWNVLLRPVAAWRRQRSTGSDLTDLSRLVNLGLTAVIGAERYLPVGRLPGLSLMVRAERRAGD